MRYHNDDLKIETSVLNGDPHTHIARLNHQNVDVIYKITMENDNCTDLLTDMFYLPTPYQVSENTSDLCAFPFCMLNIRYEGVFFFH